MEGQNDTQTVTKEQRFTRFRDKGELSMAGEIWPKNRPALILHETELSSSSKHLVFACISHEREEEFTELYHARISPDQLDNDSVLRESSIVKFCALQNQTYDQQCDGKLRSYYMYFVYLSLPFVDHMDSKPTNQNVQISSKWQTTLKQNIGLVPVAWNQQKRSTGPIRLPYWLRRGSQHNIGVRVVIISPNELNARLNTVTILSCSPTGQPMLWSIRHRNRGRFSKGTYLKPLALEGIDKVLQTLDRLS